MPDARQTATFPVEIRQFDRQSVKQLTMDFDPPQIVRQTSVRHVEYHEVLESTSQLAAELVNELAAVSPALVVASEQTAGRGRGSNVWWASRGALTFTLVLDAQRLPLPPEGRSLISLATGSAVLRCLRQRLPDCSLQIKWPNDVYIGSQKICGILTELRTSGSGPMVLIGVGINVNNSLQVAPDDIRQSATSLLDRTGESVSLNELLIELVQAIDEQITLAATDSGQLIHEINRCCLLTGRRVVVEAEQTVDGYCRGIDRAGALVIDTLDGPRRIIAGSIRSWQ